jgi:hypothetical protein
MHLKRADARTVQSALQLSVGNLAKPKRATKPRKR